VDHEPVQLGEQICGRSNQGNKGSIFLNLILTKISTRTYPNPKSAHVAPKFHWDPIHNHTTSGVWEMQLLLDGRAGPYARIFEQYQTKAECFVSAALKRTKDHKCNSHQVHFLWNFSHGEPHFSSNTCTKSNPEKCGCTYWVILGTVVVVITRIH
jgi:hypothetical protein